MSQLFLTLGASAAFAAGGACMKLSDGLRQPCYALLIYGCFFLGATLQALGMRERDLGTTYVIVLGLEAAMAYALAILLFGESPTPVRLAAVALVLLCVYLLH